MSTSINTVSRTTVSRSVEIGIETSHDGRGDDSHSVYATIPGAVLPAIILTEHADLGDAQHSADLYAAMKPAILFDTVLRAALRQLPADRDGYETTSTSGGAFAVASSITDDDLRRDNADAAYAAAFPPDSIDEDDRDGDPLTEAYGRRVELRGNVESIIADLAAYAAPSLSVTGQARKLATVITAQHIETEPALRDLYRTLALTLASAINAQA